MEKEREIAGEVEASREPRAHRDIELGPTLGRKTFKVPYGAAESLRVRRFAVSYAAEIGNRHNFPVRERVMVEKPGAGNRVVILRSRDPDRDKRIGRDLERENR